MMSVEHHKASSNASAGSGTLDLQIVNQDPRVLKPRANNPRSHTQKQIKQIAASIKTFGFVNPVLVDAQNGVLAGHGRVEAAKQLDLASVPTIRLDQLSEAQRRAYVIADNRLAELAGWDGDLLKQEWQLLHAEDLDFDIKVTGFDPYDFDPLSRTSKPPAKEDQLPQMPEASPVSRPGDVWALGHHRLLCGNAYRSENYALVLQGQKAQLIFTTLPRHFEPGQHSPGASTGGNTAQTSHRPPEVVPPDLLANIISNLVAASKSTTVHFICTDRGKMQSLLNGYAQQNFQFKDLAIWTKGRSEPGIFYRGEYELICVFQSRDAGEDQIWPSAKNSPRRRNVWSYLDVHDHGVRSSNLCHGAAAIKPVALIADAIRTGTKPRQIVFDPFMGLGTSLIAAEKTGRTAYGLEADPRLVDGTIHRFEAYSGKAAVLLATKQTFPQLRREREIAVPQTIAAKARITPAQLSKHIARRRDHKEIFP